MEINTFHISRFYNQGESRVDEERDENNEEQDTPDKQMSFRRQKPTPSFEEDERKRDITRLERRVSVLENRLESIIKKYEKEIQFLKRR